jgi:hypothetical protein
MRDVYDKNDNGNNNYISMIIHNLPRALVLLSYTNGYYNAFLPR